MSDLPIPALPLSNALLFVDPQTDCLLGLAHSSNCWRDAVVLATAFWMPGVGKMNIAINLVNEEIPSLVAASISFDPDRELRIGAFDLNFPLSENTVALLAVARRVRVLTTLPTTSTPSLLQFIPNVTAISLPHANLILENPSALASLTHLEELNVANCMDMAEVSMLAPLVSLRILSLSGIQKLTDISAVASLTDLEEVSFIGCRSLINITPLAALSSLHSVTLLNSSPDLDVSPLISLRSLRSLRLAKAGSATPKLVERLRARGMAVELSGLMVAASFPPTTSESRQTATDSAAAPGPTKDPRVAATVGPEKPPSVVETDPWMHDEDTPAEDVPLELLSAFIELALSETEKEQLHGTMMLRKLIAVEAKDPPIEEIIRKGCEETFAARLLRDDFPKLQLESARVLTNIVLSGEEKHTYLILNTEGAVSNLIRLLQSPTEECREAAALAIGNLANENCRCRDRCLQFGALEPLLKVVTAADQELKTTRNAAWALVNFFRLRLPRHEQITPAVPVVAGFMLNHTDEKVVSEGAWAVAFLADGGEQFVHKLVGTGCIPRIIELLNSNNNSVNTIVPAIRTVGYLFLAGSLPTMVMIETHALQAFRPLLAHPEALIRRETCAALGNLLDEEPDELQAVIDADLIPGLVNAVGASAGQVKRQAVVAVARACVAFSSGCDSANHRLYLVQQGVLQCLWARLGEANVKNAEYALKAMDSMLRSGDRNTNPCANTIIDFGGLERFVDLWGHSDNVIVCRAQSILESYFSC